MVAPKIKVKLGGKVGVEPEDPGEAVKEQRPKRGKRKRNELKAAHEVISCMPAVHPLLSHVCESLSLPQYILRSTPNLPLSLWVRFYTDEVRV